MTLSIIKTTKSDPTHDDPLGESVLVPNATPLRDWRPKSTMIVLGRSQKAELEIFTENAEKDQIPVYQRRGGGGCVVLDENCICIAMRYPKHGRTNVNDFLKYSSLGIKHFLSETYELDVEIKENYDLTLNNRKFLGCSLYMSKEYCLYYAVLLMDKKALGKINYYLTMPSKKPSHRQDRSHEDFLTPLFDHIDAKNYENFIENLEHFMTETDWPAGP
jgi:lipoate-protein ligase A